jgi:hypothetical protein
MPAGNVASSLALQKEYVVPKLEKLALAGSRLWKYIKLNTKIKPVSNRPVRVPLQPLTAGKFRVGNFDGGDMGLGSGPQTVPGTLSCVSFVQASQWTAQAEYTTDSDEKAIEDYVALLQSQQTETMSGYMDSLIQTDGSNTLDTVVSVSGLVVTVNNPNAFQDNQDIDFYSNLLDLGGTYLGSATILSVDAINVQVTFATAIPAGVGNGTRMLVSGSAGVSNSGLLGLRAYNVAGNTGTYMNVQKSAYPGKFNVPNFNAPGSLTPSLARAIEALMEISLGVEKADDADLTPHCNVDMMAAWENLSLNVQRVDVAQLRGDEQPDMLKKRRPRTIAGREVIVNERARPGYVDWLALEHWFQIQSKSLSLYDVKGQVVFPTYGQSGGVSASMLMYLVIMLQMASVQPRLNAYLSGVTIPKYYFGH